MKRQEKKFFDALNDIFVGAKIEGKGGYINLMNIKNKYYKEHIYGEIIRFIEKRFNANNSNREELFARLYTFFNRYFNETGSIYFQYTPLKENIYERVYSNKEDVSLFYKTHMLYYVKSERVFNSVDLKIEDNDKIADFHFNFNVSNLELAKNNEKKEIVFSFEKVEKNKIFLNVSYSAKGNKTKIDDILKSIKKQDEDLKISEEVLLKALKTYKKQSEVDYFINKDAKKFLKEQFNLWYYSYLFGDSRNQEFEISDFDDRRIRELQWTKEIAYKIIDFISQFEDELVKIWNKPKFVRKSNYVLTLDKLENNIDLIEKIINHKNFEKQEQEWKELGYKLDNYKKSEIIKNGNLNEEFKFLTIDTKYFEGIKYEILDLFDDLDNDLDGVLINSDNYQALNTLQHKYRGKVKYIHIDPPYNAKHSEIYYVNSYKNSSWLTFMENRLNLGMRFLGDDSTFMCHIDEYEYERLKLLIDNYDLDNQGTIIWDKRNPMGGSNQIANQHEYIICRTKGNVKLISKKENGEKILNKAKSLIKENNGIIDENVKSEFKKWVKSQRTFSGGETAFCEIDEKGEVYQTMHMGAPEQRIDEKFFIPLIHPITKKPCPVPNSGWSNTPDFMEKLIENNDIIFGKDETTQPRRKSLLKGKLISELSSLIYNGGKGKKDSDTLGFDFQYNHPVNLYENLLFSVNSKSGDIILDFFGGSGTTAHSVINMNKEDLEKRKYILIEMGEHFFNAIIPRIKKIIGATKWKEGKALDNEGISHICKYYCLEQYEEALEKVKYKEETIFIEEENKDIFSNYVFLKDEKLTESIELDLENGKTKIDLTKIYDDIDIGETLSNITGRKIKKLKADSVILEGMEEIKFDNLPLELVKPLIWWK